MLYFHQHSSIHFKLNISHCIHHRLQYYHHHRHIRTFFHHHKFLHTLRMLMLKSSLSYLMRILKYIECKYFHLYSWNSKKNMVCRLTHSNTYRQHILEVLNRHRLIRCKIHQHNPNIDLSLVLNIFHMMNHILNIGFCLHKILCYKHSFGL